MRLDITLDDLKKVGLNGDEEIRIIQFLKDLTTIIVQNKNKEYILLEISPVYENVLDPPGAQQEGS